MSSGIILRPRHLRTAQFCMRGGREWFASNGLSWSEFVQNGYPVETIETVGDVFALSATAIARDEADGR